MHIILRMAKIASCVAECLAFIYFNLQNSMSPAKIKEKKKKRTYRIYSLFY